MASQGVGLALGASESSSNWIMFSAAAAMLLVDGDPTGLILSGLTYGTSQLVKGFVEQSRRKLESQTPESSYGKYFGYVRDGKKWYPAYIVDNTPWYGGLGEHGRTLSLRFGENVGGNLSFQPDRTGKLRPYFNGWEKTKIFNVDDDTLKNKWSKQSQQKDGLRDFYFLNPKDTQALLAGEDQSKLQRFNGARR